MLRTLRFVVGHPLNRDHPVRALVRYASWQIGSRLRRGPVAVRFVDSTRLLVSAGMTGATGNVYCGLHEFEDMAFVLHSLRPDDVFVDVGANVGSYTVLAAGCCGAAVIAVEPSAATLAHLLDNIRLNGLESRVRVLNAALGAAPGVVRFSSNLDPENHVLAPSESVPGIEVPMTTLDRAIGSASPRVIKIDVEGFESAVLAGAPGALASPALQAVILELNGSGARYGRCDDHCHANMIGLGFRACRYDPFNRTLEPIEGRDAGGNTLYVRGVSGMQARVRGAPRHQVLGREL